MLKIRLIVIIDFFFKKRLKIKSPLIEYVRTCIKEKIPQWQCYNEGGHNAILRLWLKMLYYSKYKTRLYGDNAPSIFKKMVQLSPYFYGCWSNYCAPFSLWVQWDFRLEIVEICLVSLSQLFSSFFLLGLALEDNFFLCSCTSFSLDSKKISSFTAESILWVVHQNPLCIPDWLKINYRNME